ncbi:MAG: FAD-binding oxidoreductase [Nocardiopsaceae bacterium]|nr:FAD-binding oxidoreductase [Nocardiopsaceae bacterium]
MTHADAVVVGAGVAGLTTAISLAEAGLSTRIVTAGLGEDTTSVAAGAIWGPVRCGPPERTHAWSATGLKVLSSLAADEPAPGVRGCPPESTGVPLRMQSGVRQVSGCQVSASPDSPEGWLDLVGGVRLLGPSELPAGMASGWRYTAPVVTMPTYLEYLRARYEAAGGTIEVAEVADLSSLPEPVVVNCTGIGARDLVPDPSVYPVRGQVVVVENPGIDEFYINHTMDGSHYVYIFPHKEVVLLGGTAEEGAWDLSPRPDVAERIVADCARVHPLLRDARVVAHRVGLRPCRTASGSSGSGLLRHEYEVRLEPEPLGDGRVLWHNYGHGGGGVTLSWGCAAEITEAILESERPGSGSRPGPSTAR